MRGQLRLVPSKHVQANQIMGAYQYKYKLLGLNIQRFQSAGEGDNFTISTDYNGGY